MHPPSRSPQETRPEGGGPAGLPRCPVCGGALLPLRDLSRCTRCSYSLCLGCEGAHAHPTAEAND